MREFLSGLMKAAVTVALLASITQVLHMRWSMPADVASSPEIVQPDRNPAPVVIPQPTPVPTPVPAVVPVVPKPPVERAAPKPSTPAAPSPEEQMARGRAELMELTEKRDLEGLRAFVERNANNRNVSDWVYVARERIPLLEHEREEEALKLITGKLRDAFGKRDLNAVRVLIPNLSAGEGSAIAQMFEKCRSVELVWGRGGVYLARGKPTAEINQELEVRVMTTDGEALRARKNWVKIDMEKSGAEWVVRKARWHQSSGKGNFTAFDMPELP